MSKRSVSILILVLMLMLSCGLFATPLPTPMSVAHVPSTLYISPTDAPTYAAPKPIKFVTHTSVKNLVENIVGADLVKVYVKVYDSKNGVGYPDKRKAYYIDLYLNEDLTRKEVLTLAHEIIAETYYNYAGSDPIVVNIIIIPVNHTACKLSIGLGYKFLVFVPESRPNDIEFWLKVLKDVNEKPADEAMLAYADDFNDVGCTFYEWMDL